MNVNKTFTFPLYLSMNILLTGQKSSQPEHIDICTAAQSRGLQHTSSQTCAVITCNNGSQTENLSDKSNKSLNIQDLSLSSSTIRKCSNGKVVDDPQYSEKKLSSINRTASSNDNNSPNSSTPIELLSSSTSTQSSKKILSEKEAEGTETSSQGADSSNSNKGRRALRYPEEELILYRVAYEQADAVKQIQR